MLRSGLLAIIGCGTAPAVGPATPLPPNTELACERAIECGAVENKDACVLCIETVAEQWNARAIELYGDPLPSLEDLPCSLIADIANTTNLAICSSEGWYGP